MKKSIKEKQIERNKLVSQEKKIKKELIYIDKNIERNKKNVDEYLKNIEITNNEITEKTKIYNFALKESINLNKVISGKINFFNKISFMFSYDQSPIEYMILRRFFEHSNNKYEKEKNTVNNSLASIKKLEKSKMNIFDLQIKKKKLIECDTNEFNKKSKLLSDTQNKRNFAEKKIKDLNESVNELQKIINKINAINKKKPSYNNAVHIDNKNKNIKTRKMFQWPTGGNVIVSFGKNKHPEISNTHFVSNGIKIKASDFSKVKSVGSGIVIFSGQLKTYGKVVIIDHNDSILCIYGLLNNVFVKEKQKILKGTVIAELGSGKNNILYFEIRHKGMLINPMEWLI
jgi:murein DD-endopeptidase MepM/ murein hydrolase activator NlpD